MQAEDKKSGIKIEDSWKEALAGEFAQAYFADLTKFVKNEYSNKTVYPATKNIFSAFSACPFNQVKVVILGQDPYHGAGQANGLCFAVPEDIDLPPSLKNIFKEIESDLGIKPIQNGDLTRWARCGPA
jgi:uracil-DNA glycosylase